MPGLDDGTAGPEDPGLRGTPAEQHRVRDRRAVLAAAGAGAALVLAWVVAELLGAIGHPVVIGPAAPFLGRLDVRIGWSTVLAGCLVAVVVLHGPGLAARLTWSRLLVTSAVVTGAFAVLLAMGDGADALIAPLTSRHDYLAVVPQAAADLPAFVATFTDRALEYPIHVRGHPPGLPVLLALMHAVGLGGAGWAAALYVVVGASAVPAVAVAVRALDGARGETLVRRAAPMLVLAPAVLWVATSPDAFFAGVLAWGVALLAIASTTTGGPLRRVAWAVGAGLLLGACPVLSYGLLPMGVVALAVPWASRRVVPTVVAGAVVLATLAAWAAAGFWLPDGIEVTHTAWSLGKASSRPYLYFLVADMVVLAALVGPAGVGGLTRVRLMPTGARAAVVLALTAAVVGAAMGYERGEVERIWVPLAAWVVVAAGTLGPSRRWVASQGVAALVLQSVLDSPW